jgi:dienelactone hydrolase
MVTGVVDGATTDQRSRTAKLTIIEQVERDGMRLAEFDLAHHGRSVTGVLFQPPEPRPGAPLVCFGHGASGDRYQLPIPWLAKRLVADHGFSGLSIDGPVHGRRKVGDGGRQALWAEWQREGSIEDMVADWRLALDYAQSLPEVGTGPVGYWGLSMGTIFGAPLVAEEPRITVAVLGLMGITGPAHYKPRVSGAAGRITCPVLFLMQLEDELFPRADCLALFDALASGDKRLHANPGRHPAVPVEEMHHSVDFLVRHLSGGAPDPGVTFVVSE